MKKYTLSIITALALVTVLNANDIDEFESILDNASDIATKKSLNVDYLPSVVTVIDAQTFINGGIQNVGEALNILPGIQMQVNRMGYTTTTIRGLKSPNAYRSDKIKVLIDGVAINNEAQGSSSFYMDFPMQLVEKIEVLRGPGSTVYGAGAFYATVNIITKLGNGKKENRLFIGTGSYDDATIGGNANAVDGDWKIYTDAYYKQNDKHIEQADGFSDNGTQTDEAMQDFTIGFKAVNGGFEFLSRYKQSTYGNFYGYEEDFDPIGDQDKDRTSSYFSAQLSYKTSLNDYKLETKAGYSRRTLDAEASMDTVASVAAEFAKVGIDMQEGFWYSESSEEQNLEAEAILILPEIRSNDILLGVGARRAKMTKDDFYSSIENTILLNKTAIESHPNYINMDFGYDEWEDEPAFWSNPTRKLYKDNLTRDIMYGYVQDLISVNDSVDIALGLRLDNYSDFGTKLSKRAAIVYRATDATIFKLLYGSAFRAPTFTEKYHNGHINFRAGDENIQPEETDTYEIQVIYSPNFNHRLSLNMFYADLYNVIDLEEEGDTIPGYQNFDSRTSKGVEFEYNFRTKLEHNFYFNGSYIDTTYTQAKDGSDPQKDLSMPDISKVMLKAMYIYTPISQLSFGTTWRYESETSPTGLWNGDPTSWPRNDGVVEEQHVFDETVTYRLSSRSTFRATIKNVFDSEIKNPSYYYSHEGGVLREGRNFFLTYNHVF